MHQLSPGDVVAGYRIESVAGRGGMGVVYRATQLNLQRVVALKQIAPELANDPDFQGRFQRESRIAASLEHPHVIPVYEADEANGLLFITMRFIEGTDLYGLIRDHGRLEPRRAAAIVAQAASALDAAHARGLVHRDVKPANILLGDQDGRDHVYLTDFGLTKQASAESGPTRTGMMVGTVDYMAPEQIEGKRLDARADVYALGCVLYEALTGRVPFEKDSDMAKLFAHVNADPPSPREIDPDLPEELDEVVRRAMHKDPDERFLSTGDLGRAAVAAAEGRETNSRAERSVAQGAAAPTVVSARTAEPAPAQPPAPATIHSAEPAEPPAPATVHSPQPPAPPEPAEPPAPATAIRPTPAAQPPTPPPPAPPPPPKPPPPTPPMQRPAQPAPPGGKRRIPVLAIVGGVVALLVVFGVIGIVAGGGGDKEDPTPTVARTDPAPPEQPGQPTAAQDKTAIQAVLSDWFETDSANKCALVTDGFLEAQNGQTGDAGRAACETYIADKPTVPIDVVSSAIRGDTARVRIEVENAYRQVAVMKRVDGEWKIDSFET